VPPRDLRDPGTVIAAAHPLKGNNSSQIKKKGSFYHPSTRTVEVSRKLFTNTNSVKINKKYY